jgi:hypothetical protein
VLIFHGPNRLSNKNEPIFTLPVPGSRIYVVTEPSLAAAVQRNSRIMSFTPLIPDITKRVLGLDREAVKLIRQNLDPEPGEARGFLADMHDMVGKSLGPGNYLGALSCEASDELRLQLVEYASSLKAMDRQAEPVDLLKWVRHFVTAGTARFLFGPENPMAQEPDLEEAFWDFDHGLGGLMMGIAPSLTAGKAYRGREKLVAALMRYYEAGHHKSASKLVRDRVRIEEEYGMNQETIARSALSFLFAGIVNTTTTTFWVVLRLFADSELLSTVRSEIEQALLASQAKSGSNTLSIGTVRDECPNLMAVFRESLRIGSENFSVRLIKDDVTGPDGKSVKVPPKDDGVLPVHILEPHPGDNPQVVIKLRDDGADEMGSWEVVL